MPITDVVYNDHFRLIILRAVQTLEMPPDVLIRSALQYKNLGAVEQEAAKKTLIQLYKAANGGKDAVTNKHDFKHWLESFEAGTNFDPETV